MPLIHLFIWTNIYWVSTQSQAQAQGIEKWTNETTIPSLMDYIWVGENRRSTRKASKYKSDGGNYHEEKWSRKEDKALDKGRL